MENTSIKIYALGSNIIVRGLYSFLFAGLLIIAWLIAFGSAQQAGANFEQGDQLLSYSDPILQHTGAPFHQTDKLGVSPTSFQQNTPDLSITKFHQGDFLIGATGVYTIQVENSGSSQVTGPITVTDEITQSLSPISVVAGGWDPCGFTGQVLTCVYSNTAGLQAGVLLPPVRLSLSVNPMDVNVISNTVVVSNTNDTSPANNISTDVTAIRGLDLAVSKVVTPTTAAENDQISYIIELVNNGPNDATGVVLTDTLPGGVTYVGSTSTQGSYSPGDGLWTVGSLQNASSASLTIIASVNPDTRGTTITNVIEGLSVDQVDYDHANDTAGAEIFISTTQLAGIVSDLATGDIVVGANVVITDSMSHVYTTTTSSSGWYTFTSTVDDPLEAGLASVKVTKPGYVPKSVAPTLQSGALTRLDIGLDTTDLAITLTDNKTQVLPGEIFTYTLDIINSGSITATNVIITDVLPTYLTYITDTLGITHSIPVAKTYVWKLNDGIGPSEAVQFKLRLQVANALPSITTALTNLAKVASGSPEADLDDNTDIDTNTSTGSVSMAISLSVSPSQLSTNQTGTYTIKVSNSGTAPATDVVVTKTFSSLLDITSAKTNKGSATINTSTRKVTITIGVLKAGETATITIKARANTTARSNTTVASFATLKYKFGGSTTQKNSNTVSVRIIASSTLPGTGGIELDEPVRKPYIPAFFSAALLAILGLAAIAYCLRTRSEPTEWTQWSRRMGVLLLISAFVFGGVAWGLKSYAEALYSSPGALAIATKSVSWRAAPTPTAPYEILMPPSEVETVSELQPLPDFPIPTPTVKIAEAHEPELDTSPVNRIVIPALGVDTIVKYVPYDGLTWLIAGLQNEVAWMGDTSWPGLGGNTALAGHVTLRNGADGPFRYLSELRPGDRIYLYTEQNEYTYQVSSQLIVEETEMSVVGQTDHDQLTLITCTDWDTLTRQYRRRRVVVANLDHVNQMALVENPFE